MQTKQVDAYVKALRKQHEAKLPKGIFDHEAFAQALKDYVQAAFENFGAEYERGNGKRKLMEEYHAKQKQLNASNHMYETMINYAQMLEREIPEEKMDLYQLATVQMVYQIHGTVLKQLKSGHKQIQHLN